ncbi:hypothetical protein HZH66_002616 [Vespula vulgaris]|uniref:Uncharacterized protein n=1 Tax=Vespula vulgaris TaxID=7454 RepID=A0A834NHI6_VESVU|nr:hypothetical protein HZH66_002616 [Vespula vulgaris]
MLLLMMHHHLGKIIMLNNTDAISRVTSVCISKITGRSKLTGPVLDTSKLGFGLKCQFGLKLPLRVLKLGLKHLGRVPPSFQPINWLNFLFQPRFKVLSNSGFRADLELGKGRERSILGTLE